MSITQPERREFRSRVGRDGFALVSGALTSERVHSLRVEFAGAAARPENQAASRRAGSVYGLRNALAIPAVRAVAASPEVCALLAGVLGPAAFPVRALFFDKAPGANWTVVWHQDLSIAVRERVAAPAGWGAWSEKAGVPHVQPPAALLEGMLTIRLHLDDCGLENGPLRVLPGTHRFGRLEAGNVACLRAEISEVVCTARAGDALLMRPLLLHASSAAQLPTHRRVLHIEWAAEPLPGDLRWAEDIRQGD
jgi:ectoine hydroxylase-related dioxygenase (phytanoyl-CoA dioxygenase family)